MSFRSPYMISVKLAMTTVPRLLKSTQKERAVPNLALQRGTGFRYIFTSYELYRIINGASIPVSSEWMFRAQAPVRRAMDTLLQPCQAVACITASNKQQGSIWQYCRWLIQLLPTPIMDMYNKPMEAAGE